MWVVFAFLSAFFAGITAVLAKAGLGGTDSHLATALRMVIILPFSWLIVWITGGWNEIGSLPVNSVIFLILSGFTTGASWICYFKALSLGDVNKVVPVDKSSVILTMILAFFLLGEPFGLLKGMCLVMIGAGTWMMLEKKQQGKKETKTVWLLYALLSAVFAAATAILGKIGVFGVDSNLATAIRNIVVFIMAWLLVLCFGKYTEIRKLSGRSTLFIVLSAFSTAFSWLCYYRALCDGPASVVVPIDKLSIVVSFVAAVLIFGEKVSLRSFLGLLLIVAGTLLQLI